MSWYPFAIDSSELLFLALHLLYAFKTARLPGIKNLRQSGGLREIHDFASPPRGGFAISDDMKLGIEL
jgi:hypothetical protein